MFVYSVKALLINKDYEEEKDPITGNTIQMLPGDIYFIDDVVSVKEIGKDIPIVGRISDIRDRTITIDCSKNFSSETIDIERVNIASIKMWDCPENVLVRRHIKK